MNVSEAKRARCRELLPTIKYGSSNYWFLTNGVYNIKRFFRIITNDVRDEPAWSSTEYTLFGGLSLIQVWRHEV